jgi:hypothetical protein
MSRSVAFLAFLFLSLVLVGPGRADAPTIVIDGVVVRTDVPPLVEDGHVLVPLRGIFERFSADVEYDARDQAVTARRKGFTVRVTVGSTDAQVDGQHVALDTAPRELAGRVEVPLRFVAEALGVSVDFDTLTDTVVVVSGLGAAASDAGPSTVAAIPNTGGAEVAASYAGSAQPTTVIDERPSDGTLVGSQFPQIYARFSSGPAPVDPTTVRVLVDGIDVTDSSTVSSAYIAYTPSDALFGGEHAVEISGQEEDGTPFSARWSFRVDDDVTQSYVSSVIGYEPSPFGYRRFGFFPPGFSVYAPGPQFYIVNEPILIVFFSPFFPYGSGYFTVSGIPGQYAMTPWLGCPGYYFSVLTVPEGVSPSDSVLAANFTTSDGRKVLVHSTAPLHIDGTRRELPADIRFAVRAALVGRPVTPRSSVAFRFVGATDRSGRTEGGNPVPIARAARIPDQPVDESAQRAGEVMPLDHQIAPGQTVRPALPIIILQHVPPPPPVILPLPHAT